MARLIDEAAFRQNRMGRAPFVVPVSGHEGCQIGTAWAMRRGTDIWLPYYRDLAVVLVAGMTPYEVFLGIFSKADDPSSGGRQMPAHWGSRRLGIITRLVADRHAGSPRRRHRVRREVPRRGRRGRHLVRRRSDQRGRLARGAELRRHPQAAGDLRVREQPLRHQRALSPSRWRSSDVADRAAGYGFPGVVVDGNDVLACYGAMKDGA